jgi:hypothetical protein
LDPGANVQVVGRLVALGGAGAAGVEVALSRGNGNLCQEPLEPVAQGVTDADGRYEFFLRGRDTQLDGLARCFRVEPAPAPDGSRVRAELLFQVTRPVVPPVLHAPFELLPSTRDDGAVALAFRDFANEAGGGALKLRVRDASGQSAWETEAPAPGVVLDGPLLEDLAGLTARLQLERDVDGDKTRVALAWESATVPLGGAADMVPVSRGASCAFGGEPGCPLTDGALRPVGATADNLAVSLVFTAPVVPAELVVRALQTWSVPRTVEVMGTSASGMPVVLGSLGREGGLGAFHRVPLTPGGEPVSRLTVRWLDQAGQPVNVTGLAEVSVFGAP